MYYISKGITTKHFHFQLLKRTGYMILSNFLRHTRTSITTWIKCVDVVPSNPHFGRWNAYVRIFVLFLDIPIESQTSNLFDSQGGTISLFTRMELFQWLKESKQSTKLVFNFMSRLSFAFVCLGAMVQINSVLWSTWPNIKEVDDKTLAWSHHPRVTQTLFINQDTFLQKSYLSFNIVHFKTLPSLLFTTVPSISHGLRMLLHERTLCRKYGLLQLNRENFCWVFQAITSFLFYFKTCKRYRFPTWSGRRIVRASHQQGKDPLDTATKIKQLLLTCHAIKIAENMRDPKYWSWKIWNRERIEIRFWYCSTQRVPAALYSSRTERYN